MEWGLRMKQFRPTIVILEDQPARILLIDDLPIVREGVRRLLARYPIELDFAAEAKYGLELAKKKKYSLIIVDHGLGANKEDGIWFFKELVRHESLRDIPVLMLSMVDQSVHWPRLQKMGFAGFLAKNLAGTELEPTVARLLFREVSPAMEG
jgi:DNA-binding NarL/FixJ family response regulator